MPKFTIDTNVYIDASRVAADARALKQFLSIWLPSTYLSAVVIQELRAGVVNEEQVDALQNGLFAPFERRERILLPSRGAFAESGRILADLVSKDGVDLSKSKRSLANDTLLAASCREAGVVLVTRDRDFERIARHVRGFRHVAPWPDAP